MRDKQRTAVDIPASVFDAESVYARCHVVRSGALEYVVYGAINLRVFHLARMTQ